jgi:hypothetical protein
MKYEKQTFVNQVVDANGNVVQKGTTLKAEHLNHIEDGIAMVAESQISAVLDDNGILSFQLNAASN